MTINEAELAYFAGLVDGEGCIYMRTSSRKSALGVRLQVVNTNELLIDWVQTRFAGKKYLVERTVRATHKPLYHWHLNGASAVDLLRRLVPYLVAKKPQAELAVFAWEHREPTPIAKRREPVPAHVTKRRAEWVNDMHELNRKGARGA